MTLHMDTSPSLKSMELMILKLKAATMILNQKISMSTKE